ncbi:MAG: L-threonylcarbamoyladenylate synthase [Patescibacteria group bacterium]
MKRVTSHLAADLLKEGAVGVIPTDTIYGLVSRADDSRGVERVYKLKRRDLEKPCIVLIKEIEDINNFGIFPHKQEMDIIKDLWPGPVSIILKADKAPEYLTRKTQSLAFRLPSDEGVKEVLKVSGPLVAPSANIEGMSPSVSISDAYLYFGNKVDFYVDGGKKSAPPSRVIKLEKGEKVEIRK